MSVIAPGFDDPNTATQEMIDERIRLLNEEIPCPNSKNPSKSTVYLKWIVPLTIIAYLVLVMRHIKNPLSNPIVVLVFTFVVFVLQEFLFWIDELRFNKQKPCKLSLLYFLPCNISTLVISIFNSFASTISIVFLLEDYATSCSFYTWGLSIVLFLLSTGVKLLAFLSDQRTNIPRFAYDSSKNVFIENKPGTDMFFSMFLLDNVNIRLVLSVVLAVIDSMIFAATLVLEHTITQQSVPSNSIIAHIILPLKMMFEGVINVVSKHLGTIKTIEGAIVAIIKLLVMFFPVMFDFWRLSQPFETSQVSTNLICTLR